MKIQITADVDKDIAKALRKQIKGLFLNHLLGYERNSAYEVGKLYGRDNNYPRGVIAKVTEYNESEQANVVWEVQITETAGSFRSVFGDARYGLHFSAAAWDRARWVSE